MNIKTAFTSNNTLGFYNNLRAQNKSNINFNLEYSKNNLSIRLTKRPDYCIIVYIK